MINSSTCNLVNAIAMLTPENVLKWLESKNRFEFVAQEGQQSKGSKSVLCVFLKEHGIDAEIEYLSDLIVAGETAQLPEWANWLENACSNGECSACKQIKAEDLTSRDDKTVNPPQGWRVQAGQAAKYLKDTIMNPGEAAQPPTPSKEFWKLSKSNENAYYVATDLDDNYCVLSNSSMAKKATIRLRISGSEGESMHLDVKMTKELIAHLQRFVDTEDVIERESN